MSSLYQMSGAYRIHVTASHWVEAYDELRHRTERCGAPHRGPTPIRTRQGHAPKSSTRH